MAIKLAENSVSFSQTIYSIAEFLYFVNQTPQQKDVLLKARNKLRWDIETYNKMVSENGTNINIIGN